MLEKLWKKVEFVRAQPEHVRMRYVFLCLAVAMVFIVGVWLLSLRESVMNASRDLPTAEETNFFPEGAPSLKNLLDSGAPLQVENSAPQSGEKYFQTETQRQSGVNLEGEGVSGSAPQP